MEVVIFWYVVLDRCELCVEQSQMIICFLLFVFLPVFLRIKLEVSSTC